MKKSKILVGIIDIILAVIITCIMSILHFNEVIGHSRDSYDRNIWGQMEVSQEVDLKNTEEIFLFVLPVYGENCPDNIVFKVTILNEKYELNKLDLNKWNKIQLCDSSKMTKLSGNTKIIINSVNLDESNYIKLHVGRNKEIKINEAVIDGEVADGQIWMMYHKDSYASSLGIFIILLGIFKYINWYISSRHKVN